MEGKGGRERRREKETEEGRVKGREGRREGGGTESIMRVFVFVL